MEFFRKLSIGFAAGAVGGFIAEALLLLAIVYGITPKLGVSLPGIDSYAYVWMQLEHEVLWGAIWGLLFALPIMKDSTWWKRALLIGAFPALVILFYLFPFVQNEGLAGKDYGSWTFLVVFITCWIWGFIASAWYNKMGGK
jgi:hypothetical protein